MKMSAFTLSMQHASSEMAVDNPNIEKARTDYHANGTRTESTQDPITHEQREFTYDQHNVLVSKKVYLLNERGMTVQGNVYDGRDILKARASFLFDDFGRMIEQRMSNLQGEVYQSILFTYDGKGTPLPPKSRTYNVQAPDMKAAVIDFTNTGNAPPPMDRSNGNVPNRGNVPRLPEGGNSFPQQPAQKTGTRAAPPEDNSGEQTKKRSIWQRMFKKDEKK
ncbi:MAG: hypothetical protein JWO89_776, partial [Verrucomicrobiaceae bacterium]|nr:hypothetical protein [Verrucomicrobiaceae bacterium]